MQTTISYLMRARVALARASSATCKTRERRFAISTACGALADADRRLPYVCSSAHVDAARTIVQAAGDSCFRAWCAARVAADRPSVRILAALESIDHAVRILDR